MLVTDAGTVPFGLRFLDGDNTEEWVFWVAGRLLPFGFSSARTLDAASSADWRVADLVVADIAAEFDLERVADSKVSVFPDADAATVFRAWVWRVAEGVSISKSVDAKVSDSYSEASERSEEDRRGVWVAGKVAEQPSRSGSLVVVVGSDAPGAGARADAGCTKCCAYAAGGASAAAAATAVATTVALGDAARGAAGGAAAAALPAGAAPTAPRTAGVDCTAAALEDSLNACRSNPFVLAVIPPVAPLSPASVSLPVSSKIV